MSHDESPRPAACLPFEPLLPLVAFDEHEDAATTALASGGRCGMQRDSPS